MVCVVASHLDTQDVPSGQLVAAAHGQGGVTPPWLPAQNPWLLLSWLLLTWLNVRGGFTRLHALFNGGNSDWLGVLCSDGHSR